MVTEIEEEMWKIDTKEDLIEFVSKKIDNINGPWLVFLVEGHPAINISTYRKEEEE